MDGFQLFDVVLGSGLAVGLLVYLTWVLIHPERF
ncbi:potassium-transporting ATPase subunit F [Oleispirillum naphthae]